MENGGFRSDPGCTDPVQNFLRHPKWKNNIRHGASCWVVHTARWLGVGLLLIRMWPAIVVTRMSGKTLSVREKSHSQSSWAGSCKISTTTTQTARKKWKCWKNLAKPYIYHRDSAAFRARFSECEIPLSDWHHMTWALQKQRLSERLPERFPSNPHTVSFDPKSSPRAPALGAASPQLQQFCSIVWDIWLQMLMDNLPILLNNDSNRCEFNSKRVGSKSQAIWACNWGTSWR